MSNYNKLAALVAVSGLITVPVYADGIKGKKVNHGPAPLSAQSQHALTPPEPGCVLVDGATWKCPVPKAHFKHKPQRTQTSTATTTHYGHRTQDHAQQTHTHAHAHHGQVKRTYRTVSQPTTTTTRRVVSQGQRTVARASGLVLTDQAGFTGGVGTGIEGGFYGGGGGYVVSGSSGGSYVLGHSASRFTFNQRGGGKKGHGKKGGGGCGC